MAIPADTVWEVRTTGSDTLCGGGFSTANKGATGVDYSQQDAAKYTYTADLSGVGTTALTSAGALFTNDILGNVIFISGQGFYCVTAFTNSSTVTVDRALGTFSGATGYVGGSLASPGNAFLAHVASNTIYIKSGTYSVTSASTNVASGCINMTGGAATAITRIIGYGTTRGDNGTKPILQASGIATFTMAFVNNSCSVENITLDGAGLTSSRGFSAATQSNLYNCIVKNCTNNAYLTASSYNCEATGCATQPAFSGGTAVNCVANNNTVTGFTGTTCFGCISSNNTGASSDGFQPNAGVSFIINCTAYANGRNGFFAGTQATTRFYLFANCIAYGNTAFGFTATAAMDNAFLFNCAGGSNTSGNFDSTKLTSGKNIGFATLTSNPFTNSSGDDYSLNTRVDGGALCRAGSYPPSFLGLSTNRYQDIGAVQHKDYAAGGAISIGF